MLQDGLDSKRLVVIRFITATFNCNDLPYIHEQDILHKMDAFMFVSSFNLQNT
jgi:hypothetical protein